MGLTRTQNTLLSLIAMSLFQTSPTIDPETDWNALLKEAFAQTVLPLAYSVAQPYLSEDLIKRWGPVNRRIIYKNVQVSCDHGIVHELLQTEKIPYVILKGAASAAYYPDPLLRSMGDVDLLVDEARMEQVGRLLEANGFYPVNEDCEENTHRIYKREPFSKWEVHRTLNGLPGGKAGDCCRDYLADMVETAAFRQTADGCYMVPDTFHHGLVLLLHTAAHLTSEGIGLRHLCDWVVFAASLTDEAFSDVFYRPLTHLGLWHFARILTLCGMRYLGCPKKAWAGKADDDLLEGILEDIFLGGNFGYKNKDRYQQMKYISNRDNRTVDEKGRLRQLKETLFDKAKREYRFVRKHPLLLPLGCLAVLWRYFFLLLSGKRKPDGRKTFQAAAKRKRLYRQFQLFENTDFTR